MAWASEIDAGSLVTPAELMDLGDVAYASGIREDVRIQRIARCRTATRMSAK